MQKNETCETSPEQESKEENIQNQGSMDDALCNHPALPTISQLFLEWRVDANIHRLAQLTGMCTHLGCAPLQLPALELNPPQMTSCDTCKNQEKELG